MGDPWEYLVRKRREEIAPKAPDAVPEPEGLVPYDGGTVQGTKGKVNFFSVQEKKKRATQQASIASPAGPKILELRKTEDQQVLVSLWPCFFGGVSWALLGRPWAASRESTWRVLVQLLGFFGRAWWIQDGPRAKG